MNQLCKSLKRSQSWRAAIGEATDRPIRTRRTSYKCLLRRWGAMGMLNLLVVTVTLPVAINAQESDVPFTVRLRDGSLPLRWNMLKGGRRL